MAKGRAAPTQDDSDVEEVQQNGGSDEGSQQEEEYEIEAVLDAKPGIFSEGKFGYLVKWKGYDEDQNSWVAEEDAANAIDLIEAYWKTTKKGKPPTGRKSDVRPAQKRKSPEEAASPVSAPPKKRGRPPKSQPVASEAESEDEPVVKPVRKGRKSGTEKEKPAAKKPSASDAMDMDEEDDYGTMDKWKNLDSWEHLVERVDTVEQTENGNLFVYFRLKQREGGVLVRELARICREKMPNMLFDFYESNLRWRPFQE